MANSPSGYPDFQQFVQANSSTLASGPVVAPPGGVNVPLGAVGSFGGLVINANNIGALGCTIQVQYSEDAAFTNPTIGMTTFLRAADGLSICVPVYLSYARISMVGTGGGATTVNVTVTACREMPVQSQSLLTTRMLFQPGLVLAAGANTLVKYPQVTNNNVNMEVSITAGAGPLAVFMYFADGNGNTIGVPVDNAIIAGTTRFVTQSNNFPVAFQIFNNGGANTTVRYTVWESLR